MTPEEMLSAATRARAACWIPAHLWEDALSVGAIAVLEAVASYNPAKNDAPTAWAYAKARWAIKSFVRRETAIAVSYLPEGWDAPDIDRMDAVALEIDLAAALRKLTARERQIFLMDAMGLPRAEISRRCRIFGPHITQAVQVARAKIQAALSKGEDDRDANLIPLS